MFSFGGLELIGITAAEARDPEKSIPKAVNQVVYRILLFYMVHWWFYWRSTRGWK